MANTTTPNALAASLAGRENAERIGKAFVRPFLRRHFTRDVQVKGSSWNLTPEQIACVTAAYKARQRGESFDIAAYRKSLRARKPKATAATVEVSGA